MRCMSPRMEGKGMEVGISSFFFSFFFFFFCFSFMAGSKVLPLCCAVGRVVSLCHFSLFWRLDEKFSGHNGMGRVTGRDGMG